ncbi:hypothetical protein [Curtobacterium flaccumfaciens]|uniref:hypothetical protein n=1 Tax=Curtobacterium flaccumfaciens TaxID=2035 RepID=UPI001BDED61F|nr:hypothetical protein [Curtobacterium flaccumfaciens]MBT1681906.1 hypothetical protein [Curtobacterium flaccumfaciens pv. flaccumfaciens]
MSDHERARNTRESDEDAQRGLRFLQLGFARLTALEQRIESLDVTERSSLDGDRAATRYNPIPDQLVGLLVAATDHLRAVQVTVEDSGGKILAMALFTLIRSAIEMSGTGLWILEPKSRDDRVLRSFALTWDNRRQVRSVKTELGHDPAKDAGFNRMQARVEQLIDERPRIKGTRISKVDSVTGRLGSISGLVPDLVEPPLILWQMASGIAHGNTSMMQGVLEQKQLSPFVGGSASFELTTSVVTLAMFYDAALTLVARLVEMYDARNASR